jgi:Protein of unknown function (DUF3039)
MSVIESPVIEDSREHQEPDFWHVIRKEDQMRGYVLGEEIEAICGYRFIPTRDPNKFPPCPACKQALQNRL